ncbi:hypothetical protein A6J80_17175 [Paracoccus yeei]|uniref:Uncharacterized protein n=1 Tax=Paracoccus yeei TaxID=147645 RepID=A0A1V0GVL1_9RHOB|nr:hypothetical protein [Paracoccus yeei]ARC37848.1 hypothetical protein A6J80_17175 [Paracoccus yeei]
MDERFSLVDKHLSEGGGGYMEPDDQGDWVRYSDLAAARAEIERLKRELEITHNSRNELAETWKDRAIKAEAERDAALKEQDRLVKAWQAKHDYQVKQSKDHADYFDKSQRRMHELVKERDEALSMLADAERDMRQRVADYLQSAANDWRSDGHEHNAKKIEDEIPGVLALPLKHADREGGV